MLYTDLVLARSLGDRHLAVADNDHVIVVVLQFRRVVRIRLRGIDSGLLWCRHNNSAVLSERISGVEIAARLDDDLCAASCLTMRKSEGSRSRQSYGDQHYEEYYVCFSYELFH